MGAAPGPDHGMNLVDDHRMRVPQHLAASLGGQQQIQRFGSGHQNVRRRPQHRGPLAGRGVARADRRGDARRGQTRTLGGGADAAPRLGQVFMDIGAQRLERRDVDDADLVGQGAAQSFLKQVVESRQKGGECLARAGGRRNQRVLPLADRGPSATLHFGRDANRPGEPF